MRERRNIYANLMRGLAIILMSLSLSVICNASQAESLTWYIELAPNNPGFLHVILDARRLARNRVVYEARFQVSFYDGKRLIGEERINFLDKKFPTFTPDVYERLLKHSNKGATRIHSGKFHVLEYSGGGSARADSVARVVAEAESSDWGSAPAQRRLIDYWPPDVAVVPSAEIYPDKVYFIISVLSGKAMDAKDRSSDDWTPVIQTTVQEGVSQQWRFEALHGADEGFFHIRSARSDKCLDVRLGDKADSTAIIQYVCGDGDGQKWRIIPKGEGYQLQAQHSGKVVDVPGESVDDVPLIQYGSHFGKNQQWRIRETP